MGIVIKQSFRTLSITYFGMIIGLFSTLWLYPFLLKEEEVGLVRTLINLSVFLSSFAAMGASQIPIKYFPYFKDKEKQHNGILTFLLLIAIIGFVLCTVILFISDNYIISIFTSKAPLLVDNLYYVPVITCFIMFFSIFESYAIVNHESVATNFIKEILLRLFMFIGLLLVLIKVFSFNEFISLVAFSYLIILLILISYIYFKKFLFLTSPIKILQSTKLKEILVFGGVVLLGNASGSLMMNIDGLMLSAFEGLRSTGIYTISYFIATIIEVPRRALSQAVIPFVSNANKENDYEKLKVIYKSSSINQLLIGSFIFILIWTNIDNLFQLIPNGEIYKEGKWVVFFLGIGKLFDLATGVNAEIVGTSKYYKYDILFFILLGILGIATSYYLIPLYGINGAAIATAISILLVNTIRFIFIYLVFKIQPFTFGIIKIIFASVVSIYLINLVPFVNNIFIDSLLRILVLILVYLIPIYFFNVSIEINNTINKLINRIKH